MPAHLWTWLARAFASPTARAAERAAREAARTRRQSEILARFKTWERTAWLPQTTALADPSTLHPAGSWFGGPAGLPRDDAWPTCPTCRVAMHCFAQLNSRDLPSGVHPFGDGVFQLFYCVGEQCSPWDPFAPGHVRRVIRTGLDRLVLTTRPGGDEFPAKQITGWTPQPDYPSIEEIKDLISPKRELTDEEFNALCDGPVYYPLAGEKLMGWPHWVQSVEYPACPQCATRMEAFLQVDSEKNVPFMFGDCGSGHVCVCPSHRDVLSFCWACS